MITTGIYIHAEAGRCWEETGEMYQERRLEMKRLLTPLVATYFPSPSVLLSYLLPSIHLAECDTTIVRAKASTPVRFNTASHHSGPTVSFFTPPQLSFRWAAASVQHGFPRHRLVDFPTVGSNIMAISHGNIWPCSPPPVINRDFLVPPRSKRSRSLGATLCTCFQI